MDGCFALSIGSLWSELSSERPAPAHAGQRVAGQGIPGCLTVAASCLHAVGNVMSHWLTTKEWGQRVNCSFPIERASKNSSSLQSYLNQNWPHAILSFNFASFTVSCVFLTCMQVYLLCLWQKAGAVNSDIRRASCSVFALWQTQWDPSCSRFYIKSGPEKQKDK